MRAAHVAITHEEGDLEIGVYGVFDGHGAFTVRYSMYQIHCASQHSIQAKLVTLCRCAYTEDATRTKQCLNAACEQLPSGGAGGGEVARFCSHHLAQELWQLESFKQGNVGESLIQVRARGDPEAVATQLTVTCQAGTWLNPATFRFLQAVPVIPCCSQYPVLSQGICTATHETISVLTCMYPAPGTELLLCAFK